MHHPINRRSAVPLFGLLLAVSLTTAHADQTTLNDQLTALQKSWDSANFTQTGDAREKALAGLVKRAGAITAAYPGRAEPLVWQAIVLSSYAGARGGLGALDLVKKARDVLLEAEKIDPNALHGGVYTSLGSLYYQVPGWPIGFGNDNKAQTYLKKALADNPDDIDANYFYGDFLIQKHDYPKAIAVLEHALSAPARPGRQIADRGRRKEIRADLEKAKEEAKGSFSW